MERRSKLLEIDLVRGIAILGVMMVHSTSNATIAMKESGLYGVYNFFNIFSKIGTTSFIFLSSFVLFYNYFPQPITGARMKKFYSRRLLLVVVPYIVFSALYFLYTWKMNGKPWDLEQLLPTFWDRLITGKAYTHLYFVFINIQLYLLFPILLFLFKRYRWLAASAIFVGVALQWAFFLYNREYWQIPNRASWAPTYFGQYFLGAWLGIYFDQIKSWIIISKENFSKSRLAAWIVLWGVWLTAGLTDVTNYYYSRLDKTYIYTNFDRDLFWDIYTMLTPIVLMQLAFLVGGAMNRSFGLKLLRHLGMVSFGVYLLHPFVLLIYRKFPPQGGSMLVHHLWYLGGYLCAVIISWVIVTVVSKLFKSSWILFGNVPGQLAGGSKKKEKVDVPA
ncbi:MAG: acyltransferase [Candidatus Cohnella colombiensis]|uniref:Acyltransferase n=1 Tax=Candidatus Cohnella colombiensis TaxID=3121368 RepID=A0AA95EXU4_9BACL|nr:MAG: acyltransferase [Cohnella sp.]